MKQLFFALVAVIALASCANNSTSTSVSDSTKIDSTKCDTTCSDTSMPVKCLTK